MRIQTGKNPLYSAKKPSLLIVCLQQSYEPRYNRPLQIHKKQKLTFGIPHHLDVCWFKLTGHGNQLVDSLCAF